MAGYLVWSQDLGETEVQARTVEANSYASAAIAAHRALVLDSGADVETAYNVRLAADELPFALRGINDQLITVTPITMHVAARLR